MSEPSAHHIDMQGARIHYWVYGEPAGEPVLLIHGFRGDHHGLELIAQRMPGTQVIVPDLPGFGRSSRLKAPHTLEQFGRWLRAFTAEVLPRRYHLVGHSFGSLIVSQAVAQGLEPLSLTLINPISAPALAGPRGILTWFAVQYYRLAALLPEVVGDRLLRSRLIVRIMSESMAKTQNPSLRAWIHGQHDSYFSVYSDRDALLEAFRASVEHSIPDFMSTFSMPVTVIAGDLDDITPLDVQLRTARSIPNCSIRVIRGSGHLVHYEAPDAVAVAILETMAAS